ncbi:MULTISPECIES: hypothetical protein [Methylobacterium]|uniref:hypothetical protein n=1 Tax=Methylobacterium TaxID=407 RepID=UPI0013EC0087|nr:hypothetical protein [Methylobacterium sp. DB0501]NGM35420.1 hypothetical protein [Methylobacterium sp. DB0501]
MIRALLSAIHSNPFGRRRPTAVEIPLQIVFAFLIAGLVYDFFDAYNSLGCRDPRLTTQSGCYPWGGTEGPLDGAWNYMSKELYLKTSILSILSVLIMISAPFLTRTPWYTPIGLGMVYFFNGYAAEWVVGLF